MANRSRNTNTTSGGSRSRVSWRQIWRARRRRGVVRSGPRARVLGVRRGSARTASFAAARMAYRWPWRPGLAGLAIVFLGWLVSWAGWSAAGARLAVAGATVTLTVTAWWWARHVARPHTTKALIARRAELDQRCGGVATMLDIAEHAGPKALRLKAPVLRPSTRDLSWWARRRLDVTALGVLVATTGWGLWGQQVWSSCEDTTLTIGGPRVGKTQSMACYASDAPGALLTTSTRLDLAEQVHQARSSRGAVHVFNPAGLGGLPSTLRWRVLAGCGDFATAQRRAADLMPAGTGEGERWDVQGRRILALLLHAAEASGRSLRDVVRWASSNSADTQTEVTEALLASDGVGAKDRVAAMRTHWGTTERTRSSINSTLAVPLAWMADDRARDLGDADRDDPLLIDIAELIERGQTLHLIGHEDHTTLSPLIAALVAEIAHAARTLAAGRPGGRLDPPLTMVLDEAAIVAPVPLDRWTADMGGRGVPIHISVQSLAQLRQRWGEDGAAAILANVATFLVFGGSPSAADQRDLSALTGEHRMKVIGVDHDTPTTRRRRGRGRRGEATGDGLTAELRGEYRWVPVLSPAQIRALEPGQVLVMRRGLHTLVGWAPQIHQRRGFRPTSLVGLAPHLSADGRRIPSAAELEELLAQTAPDPTGRGTAAWQRITRWAGRTRARAIGVATRLHRATQQQPRQGSHK